MCVIIYKKQGIEIPTKSLLRKAWTANPDGAGLAYNDGKQVHFVKGFTSFKEFYNTLLQLDLTANLKSKDLVLHFRIATSGGVTPQKTHPFEICNSFKKMERLEGTCKSAFFHNGVMSDFASSKYSDTENFNYMILANIKNVEHQPTLIDYLARANNSKFAIITKDRVLLGGDFLSDGDYLASNKNYTYYYNDSYNYYDKTKYSYYNYKDYQPSYLYSDYNKLYD